MLSTLVRKENLNKKQSSEDSIWFEETPERIVGVVADGCSDSVNSAFASRLLCYLFRRFKGTETINNFVMEYIITDLKEVNDLLSLPEKHLLSTFIPFIYNKNSERLRIRPFGDCIYYVNGVEYIIEQNNTPDYIGYQIIEGFAGNYMYLEKYPELVYENVESFIIMSDGFSSFSPNQFEKETSLKDVYKLLEPPTSANYLERQYNILKRKKFTNSDDVSIISYIKD